MTEYNRGWDDGRYGHTMSSNRSPEYLSGYKAGQIAANEAHTRAHGW